MATVGVEEAQKIMGQNFIGPNQLSLISDQLNIVVDEKYPEIPYSAKDLEKYAIDYVLILGISKDKNNQKLNLINMRSFFGVDPKKNEPCFYNQDWYLSESFAKENLESKWYLIKINVNDNSRAIDPEKLQQKLKKTQLFPSAILTAYTFFAYYFLNKKMIWKNDFIWCKDKDGNGDRIYTGRYADPKGLSKNGFNIHRHLSIKQNYGLAEEII